MITPHLLSKRNRVVIDSNYEAQKQFVSERLATYREQAGLERRVRIARPERMRMLSSILSQLFRKKRGAPEQPEVKVRPAIAGQGIR
jgi:hypothetical protein